MAKFNELAHFALSIVLTDEVCKMKFMLGLRVDVSKQIDSGSHGPKSFNDTIQRALRNESWDRGEPRMAPIKEERAVLPADRSLASGTKRSFRASVGSSRNSERRNFRVKRFNRGSSGYSSNQSMSRGSDNRTRASFGKNTPANRRTQSILRPAMNTGSVGLEQATTLDRKSTRLNSSHSGESRMPSSA